MTATDAADRAVGILARLLPEGLRTPQHHIQRLLDDDQGVGELWLQVDARTRDTGDPDSTGTDAFLYDIRLTPESLARGLGPAAMDLAEQRARDLGATVLRVNVFTDDAVTRALVEGRGYEPAATQMVLRLDGAAPSTDSETAAGTAVVLRAMTPAEYETFLSGQEADYAAEIVASGSASAAAATAKAAADMAELLPDGRDTPNQLFWTAYADAVDVGWLWLQLEPGLDGARAFVLDVGVHEPFRRRGHGRSIMRAAEQESRDRGAVTIGLSVFGHNHGARALYDSLGYQPTEVLRRKVL